MHISEPLFVGIGNAIRVCCCTNVNVYSEKKKSGIKPLLKKLNWGHVSTPPMCVYLCRSDIAHAVIIYHTSSAFC